ncbi:MAG: carbohydrate binding domain-containing protein [Chitinispirillaceae bacterium]|nr:carbohydrate binding domain-containing protein [Chitinispirillaceae bacterium]
MRYFQTTTAAIRRTGIVIAAMCCTGVFASSEPDLVKNGNFSSSTLTNWTLARKDSANVSGVITGGQYVVTRAADAAVDDTDSWNIQFSHKAISMEKGKNYTVSFKVKADSTFVMEVNVGMNRDPWESYSGYQQYTVKNTWDSLSFEFTMTDSSDAAARLVFDMGRMRKKGTISLDDISMKAASTVATGELVRNGDFSSTSVTSWTLNLQKGAAATRSVVDGQLVVDITKFAAPDSIPERYFIQLQQTGIKLQKGLEYEIKFHAKSDSIYQIMAYLGQNKDPWANYSGWGFSPMLSPEWDTSYSYTFIMDSTDDVGARLVFDIGDPAGEGVRKVYLDNISVKSIGGVGAERNKIAPVAAPAAGFRKVLKNGNLEIGGVSAPVSAELFNASGKVVATFSTICPVDGTVSFAINRAFVKGLYIIRMTEKTGRNSVRLSTFRFINR